MVYIVGWLSMFLTTFLFPIKGWKLFGFLVLLYCGFIAFFRADVGTDTTSYIAIFDAIRLGGPIAFNEFGFYLLAKSLLMIFADPIIAVKAVSLIFFILLGIFFLKADKNESFLFISYLLPAFSYAYSMNALRIGIAFSIFILIFQSISKHEYSIKKWKYLFIPVFFHYSIFIFPVLMYIYNTKWLSSRFFIGILFISFIFVFFIFFYEDYFVIKTALYSNYSAPSVFSGARSILPIIIILIGTLCGKLLLIDKFKVVITSLMLIILAMIMTQFTYAGLRVLDLLSSIIPLIILFFYQQQKINFDIFLRISLILAGAIYATATYFGFVGEYGNGSSPFLPYHFNF